MNGRSRGVKRRIIVANSTLLLVAIVLLTGVGATMLRSSLLSFCSKTTILSTKTTKPRKRPSFLVLQQTAITEEFFYHPNRRNTRSFSSFFPSPIATSKDPVSAIMPKRRGGKGPKFYAVAEGRNPGIYATWKECQSEVMGFSNAIFKSFSTTEEAESYFASNSKSATPSVAATFSGMAASMKKRQRTDDDSNANAGANPTARKKTAASGSRNAMDADTKPTGTTTPSTRNSNSSNNTTEPSSEYVPRGSFTGYVDRNMERHEVQNNPELKQHVETEIDKLLAGDDLQSINWNLVPLVALPDDDEPTTPTPPAATKKAPPPVEDDQYPQQPQKQTRSKARTPTTSGTRIKSDPARGAAATRSNTDTTNDDHGGDDSNNDLPPLMPHKLFFHVMFDGGSRGNPHGHAGAGTYIATQKFYHSDSNSNTKKGKTTKAKAKTIIARNKASIRTYLGLGQLTNNQAEYQGLVTGLEHILEAVKKAVSQSKRSPSSEPLETVTILVQGDSDLIIKQTKGIYACKSPKLKSYHRRTLDLVKAIKQACKQCRLDMTFEHVYRADNKIADALANNAMDAQKSWTTTTVSTPPLTRESDNTKKSDGDNDAAIEV